jgi:hypothetical protein
MRTHPTPRCYDEEGGEAEVLPLADEGECCSNGGRSAMAKDVVVLLVKEITRSKDETIQAKDQLIEFLMTRKFVNCADGE